MKIKNKKLKINIINLIVFMFLFNILMLQNFDLKYLSDLENKENSSDPSLKPISSSSSSIKPIWNVTWMGSTGNEEGYDVVTDNAGNVYMAGSTRSFSGGISSAFVTKYSPSGIQLWNNTWGEFTYSYGKGVAVDDNGNVYLTGYSNSYTADYDIFLAKYSSVGTSLWNDTCGWTGYDKVSSISLNGTDQIFIAGNTDAFGGFDDAFIIKYDSSGNNLWNTTWSTPIYDRCNDILVNGSDIYITGVNDTDDDFGGADNDNAFLAKFSGDPAISVWNRTYVSIYHDEGFGLAMSNDGNITFVGRSLKLSYSDYLIVQYKPNGDLVFEMLYRSNDQVLGRDIVYDENGNFYIAGTNFGSDINAELMKFNSTRNHVWNISWGKSDAPDNGYGIALNGSDYVYMCGSTRNVPGTYNAAFILQLTTNIIPDITEFSDFQYEYSSVDNNITWKITDPDVQNPNYAIYINNTPGSDIAWNSGDTVEISVDGMEVGIHNITIVVNDGLGKTTQNEVIVTVYNDDPVVSHPSDNTYIFGQTGNTIIWTITDDSVAITEFSILCDGNEINTSIWISGNQIVQNIDSLLDGSNNITIIVDDGLDGITQDEVFIIVTNDIPIVTHPEDLNYKVGNINNIISWTITDTSVYQTSYIIKLDGVEVESGGWTSDLTITIEIDGLSVGEYEYTIIIDDGNGETIEDSVIVTVASAATGLTMQIVYWITGGTVSAITGITIRGTWKKIKNKKSSKKNKQISEKDSFDWDDNDSNSKDSENSSNTGDLSNF